MKSCPRAMSCTVSSQFNWSVLTAELWCAQTERKAGGNVCPAGNKLWLSTLKVKVNIVA